MDHFPGNGNSFQDWAQLDENEPSWQNAVIGFLVIFVVVGLFFLLWIGLFQISAP